MGRITLGDSLKMAGCSAVILGGEEMHVAVEVSQHRALPISKIILWDMFLNWQPDQW